MSRVVINGTIGGSPQGSVVSGKDLGLVVNLNDLYSFYYNSICYGFQVTKIVNNDTINIVWKTPDGTTKFPPFNQSFTYLERGLFCGVNNDGLFDVATLRSGYFQIDDVVLNLFKDQISNWDWTAFNSKSKWQENSDTPVPVFFRHRRPVLRDGYSEGKLEKTTSTTFPYIAFNPLDPVSLETEFPKIESWLHLIPDALASGDTDSDFPNIETYQAPKAYEFIYQVTGVADSWKDAQILKSHLQNGLFPEIEGERIITFPSGFDQRITKVSEPVTNVLEERGVFEVSVEYTFQLPIIRNMPELTWRWLTLEIDLYQDLDPTQTTLEATIDIIPDNPTVTTTRTISGRARIA